MGPPGCSVSRCFQPAPRSPLGRWSGCSEPNDPEPSSPGQTCTQASTVLKKTYETTRRAYILPISPNGHLPKEDAQSRCGRRAAVHPPQVQNQGQIDERGDDCPCGVQSQTIVGLPSTHQSSEWERGRQKLKMTSADADGTRAYQYTEAGQVFAVVRLQPQPVTIGGGAAEEQRTNVGNTHHD